MVCIHRHVYGLLELDRHGLRFGVYGKKRHVFVQEDI